MAQALRAGAQAPTRHRDARPGVPRGAQAIAEHVRGLQAPRQPVLRRRLRARPAKPDGRRRRLRPEEPSLWQTANLYHVGVAGERLPRAPPRGRGVDLAHVLEVLALAQGRRRLQGPAADARLLGPRRLRRPWRVSCVRAEAAVEPGARGRGRKGERSDFVVERFDNCA